MSCLDMHTPNQGKSRLPASFTHSVSQSENTLLGASDAQPVHSQNAQPGISATKTSVSRTDLRYWLERVAKVIGRGGKESPHYSVQIAHLGTRHRFKLTTADKRTAAAKAQTIYQTILVNGWEAALAEHNPKAARRTACATIGEYLEELMATVQMRKSTERAYIQALRKIAAGVANIGDQPAVDANGAPLKDKRGRVIYLSRKDCYNGGGDAWRAKVDSLPLSKLTDGAIQKWKLAYLAEHGTNPLTMQKAKHTVNSLIRSARSLFSNRKDRLKHLRDKLTLPEPLPFQGVAMEDEASKRYVSSVDGRQLIASAKRELASKPERREQFKVFCLGLLVGLRRGELDALLWEQVNFELGQIHIRRTQYFEPKSKDAEAKVDVDPEILALLRGWKAQAKGPFVVESKHKPLYDKNYRYVRASEHFKALYQWLETQGIKDQKKFHTLRKELGSILASEQGIFAAQQVLRHAHIQTTARFYADKRGVVTAGLGALLVDHVPVADVLAFPTPEPVTKPIVQETKKRTARKA